MHIETLQDVNHEKILQEANDIKVMLGKGWKDVTQIGLQGFKPNLNWKDHWDKSTKSITNLEYPETYYKYPLFDLPNINRLIEKYGMVRTRIMVSAPKTNLSFHKDLTKRIHIPLITNPDCIMIIEDSMYHLKTPKMYLTNTTLRHTAVNASFEYRVHIVGCIYS